MYGSSKRKRCEEYQSRGSRVEILFCKLTLAADEKYNDGHMWIVKRPMQA